MDGDCYQRACQMIELASSGTLMTIAQLSLAIIGFTGVVLVFGRRVESQWTGYERAQFYAMVVTPLTALFCSFIPGLLALEISSEQTIWRLSNLFLGTLHLINFIGFFLVVKKTGTISSIHKITAFIGFLFIVSQFLAAALVLPWLEMIFILGLLQQLAIGIQNFVLLLSVKD